MSGMLSSFSIAGYSSLVIARKGKKRGLELKKMPGGSGGVDKCSMCPIRYSVSGDS